MIIGIVGKKGSGKSTVCEMLHTYVDLVSIPLADSIKRGFVAMFPYVDPACVYGASHLRETEFLPGITVRHALQTLGTEWGRQTLDPDIWVDAMLERASGYDCTVVVPDVRFENEMRAIRREGGHILHLLRGWDESADTHASEAQMDCCIYKYRTSYIDNRNLTLEDLSGAVRHWAETYLGVG